MHFMITFIKFYQNALPTPIPSTGFTRCLYSVHTARHGALKDSTALSQRPHSTLFNTLCKRRGSVQTLSRGVCFEHVQNKRRRMAF